MRPLVAAVACCLLTAWSQANGGPPALRPNADGDAFPYKAVVAADEVFVRSGPGADYYPTGKLRRGQEVEVYRREPGGWCAIRPPSDSFTWVAGRYVQPTEKNLAEITEDGVSAHVGSRISTEWNVIQVRLQKGETVELLDPPPAETDRRPREWVRIAPPAGEFRWVAEKDLASGVPPRQWNAANSSTAGPASVNTNGSASAAGHASENSNVSAAGSASAGSPAQPADAFQAELDRIDVELATIVVEPPAVWSFDSLRERTNVLLDQAPTAVQRGRARAMADKIARFEDIKQRREAVMALGNPIDRAARFASGARPNDSTLDAKRADQLEIDGRFDGVGRLTQVDSPKHGGPRYALVDADGKVRSYVTPAPGVKVQSYLGRPVGVIGTRGYVPEERTSHIMARRVMPLEPSALR